MAAHTGALASRSSVTKRGPTPSGEGDRRLRRVSVLDALPANLALLDALGTVVAVNEPWRRFAAANGLDLPAGLGLNYLEVCERASAEDPEGAGRVGSALREILNGHRDVFSMEYPCHSPIVQLWFRIEIARVYDDLLGNGALVLHHDITQKRLAEDKARDAERRHKAVFDLHFQFLAILSPQGEVLEINDLALHVGGVDREQIVGHPFWQTVWWTQQPGIRDWWADLLRAAAVALTPLRREGVYNTSSGETRDVEITVTAVRDELAALDYYIVQGIDTTERRREARARLASEVRLRAIVNGSPVPQLLAVQEGLVTFVNPAFVRAFGYTPEEIPTLDDWWSRACPETGPRQAFLAAWGVVMATAGRGLPVQPLEIAVRCRSGAARTVLASPASIHSSYGNEHTIVFYDITDRKQAEETLRQNETLLRIAGRAAKLGAYTVEMPGEIVTWSEEACLLQGVPIGTVPSLQEAVDFYAPEWRPAVRAAFENCVATGAPFDLECEGITAAGQRIWVRALGQAERGAGGSVVRVQGAIQDITDRKAAEVAVVASLREKEALLKEVHHRVNNNMQVMASLLRLEGNRVAHDATRVVLRDMQNRIQSMAMLHGTLYRSGNFAEVNLADYLRQLTRHLRSSATARSGRIEFHLDLDGITLDLDRAVPCGLIVNELVSNALKHAFPDGRTGSVWIGLSGADTDSIRLDVRDDGVGMAVGATVIHPSSLGLQLVSDLARQMGGMFILPTGNAAAFSVRFPKRLAHRN